MTSPATLQSRLAEARAAVSGEYASVDRVVDTLLDFRSLAGDRADLLAEIDRALGSIPGNSVTPNEWWLSQLARLEVQLGRSGDGDLEALTAG
ncbi:MAG: hypothetical protein OEV40_16545 [Acidimicrobiia bacterium]|nr:hypothetical protein [Acidimicrobiia bacterium]